MINEEIEVFETIKFFIENGLANKVDKALTVISDDVMGIGMNEQGTIKSKKELHKLLSAQKSVFSSFHISYPKTEIKIHNSYFATASVVYQLHFKNSENKDSSIAFIQSASAKKTNGKWLLCMLQAIPVELTQSTIDNYPIQFAEDTLQKLKNELQQETFTLLNKALAGGIISVYSEGKYPLHFINDSMIKTLGYDREEFEIIFKNGISNLIYSADTEVLKNFITGDEKEFSGCVRFIKKDKSIVWLEIRTQKTKDELDKDILLSVAIDVSELVTLRKETEEQNKTILSGMRYASKIQKNILSSVEEFHKIFSDCSILWKPKDIVSGDSYWLKHFKSGSVLCAFDCTGHGIPGALITMLVSSLLDMLVTDENCSDIAQILLNLDNRILNILNSNNTEKNSNPIFEIKDGCDMALIFISKDKNIKIASANIRIFMCNGKETILLPVQCIHIGEGKIENKENIKILEMEYNSDNEFYISSDGLFDQIGEKTHKNFGYNILKDTVLKMHGQKLSIISDEIYKAFKNHQGSQIRRDDIELISFRL